MSELILVFAVIGLTALVLVGILSVFATYVRIRGQIAAGGEPAAAMPSKPATKIVAGPERPGPHRSLAA